MLGKALAGRIIPLRSFPQPGLPLHAKDVPRIIWKHADEIITDRWREAYEFAKEHLTSAERLQSTNMQALSAGLAHQVIEAKLEEGDTDTLLRLRYIEEVPRVDVKGTVKVFTVPEKMVAGRFTRRRLILCPTLFNEILTDPGDIELPSVEDVQSGTADAYAFYGDFEAWFIHFELPPEARNFFCFPHKGKWFRSCVICTGQRQCPALAHAVCASLAERAACGDAKPLAYIDNVRFSGSMPECAASWDKLLDLASQLPAKLQLDSQGVEYDFLGVRCEHGAQQSRATQKTIDKVVQMGALCLTDPERTTLREWLRLLGLLMWCSRVAASALGCTYPFIKFVRRKVARDPPLDDAAPLWPCLRASLSAWINFAVKNQARRFPHTESQRTILVSDASPEGWCAIIFEEAKTKIVYGPFAQRLRDTPIANLEALATLFGARHLAQTTGDDATIRIVVDNTSWCGVLAKERSPVFSLQSILEDLARTLAHKGFRFWEQSWIGSLSNPADAFTRIGATRVTVLF